jgi:hypothetical protein
MNIEIPKKAMTGFQVINWLRKNQIRSYMEDCYEAFNESHILRVEIGMLRLYHYDRNSQLPDKNISQMDICLDVIMGNFWQIRDRSIRIFTSYEENEYDITGCNTNICFGCQYRSCRGRNGAVDEDNMREYEEICVIDKQPTDGNRHTWCIAQQHNKQLSSE